MVASAGERHSRLEPKLSNPVPCMPKRCLRSFTPVEVVATRPWTNAGRSRSECFPRKGRCASSVTMTVS